MQESASAKKEPGKSGPANTPNPQAVPAGVHGSPAPQVKSNEPLLPIPTAPVPGTLPAVLPAQGEAGVVPQGHIAPAPSTQPAPPLGPLADKSLNGKSPGDAAISDEEHQKTLKHLAENKAKEDANKAPAATGATVDGLPPPPSLSSVVSSLTGPAAPVAVADAGKDGSSQPSSPAVVKPAKQPPSEVPAKSPPQAPETAALAKAADANAPKDFFMREEPPAEPAPLAIATNPNPVAPPPVPAPAVAPSQKTNEPPAPLANLNTAQAPGAFNKPLTNPNLPPLGSEPKTATAPIAVPSIAIKPVAASLPEVKSFTPQTYFCKPEDTSFEAISTRVFGSPKYARALLLYNRDHPLAKDNLLQDNPRLLPNQEIFIPPREYLETRFAASIDNRPSPVAKSDAPAITIGPPPNSNPAVQAAGVPRPAVPTTDATKPYRVPGQGQMLIEIAQQTLGDRGRWSEIYRLNPALRPEYPIPGGTEIRLPGNANVP
jgi:hypothetical protein